MGRALAMIGLGLGLGLGLVACGPQLDPPVGDDGSQGATTQSTALTTAGTSSGDDTTAGSVSDASSGEPSPLVPPGSVITTVICNDDGTIQLEIEMILVELEACSVGPEVLAEQVLYIVLRDWHGLPGTFEAGPGGPALAAFGVEEVTGTITLDVWAPTHPSRLTVDLAAETTVFEGFLELETCTLVNEAPCAAPVADG